MTNERRGVARVERLLVHLVAVCAHCEVGYDFLLLRTGARNVKYDRKRGSIELNVGVVDSDGCIVLTVGEAGG